MRYAQIRSLDISNGEGCGVALFVQGCDKIPHCRNCFNPDTWDFNGGKEWTEETKNKFLELIDRPYIKRVSLLGGECLAEQNLDGVLDLIQTIREKYPIPQNNDCENPYKSRGLENDNSDKIRISYSEKSIWLYTGYTLTLHNDSIKVDDFWNEPDEDFSYFETTHNDSILEKIKRRQVINLCNVVVDGEYIDDQRDITLKFRGSKNQRVIDIKQSLTQGKVVLYCD